MPKKERKIIRNFIANDIWKRISDGWMYFISVLCYFQQGCQKLYNRNIIIYMYHDKKECINLCYLFCLFLDSYNSSEVGKALWTHKSTENNFKVEQIRTFFFMFQFGKSMFTENSLWSQKKQGIWKKKSLEFFFLKTNMFWSKD